jgi:hypothetical protein
MLCGLVLNGTPYISVFKHPQSLLDQSAWTCSCALQQEASLFLLIIHTKLNSVLIRLMLYCKNKCNMYLQVHPRLNLHLHAYILLQLPTIELCYYSHAVVIVGIQNCNLNRNISYESILRCSSKSQSWKGLLKLVLTDPHRSETTSTTNNYCN